MLREIFSYEVMFGDIISQRYDFYVIYKVRIGQNRCQMTQKHTFFEKRVEKFWKFRNSYYFCAPKQTGCSSARLEYTSGGRVVAGSNPVIPTTKNANWTNRLAFFVLPPMFNFLKFRKQAIFSLPYYKYPNINK